MTTADPDFQLFSTAGLAASDKLGCWHQLIVPLYGRADTEALGEAPLDMRLKSRISEGIVVSRFRSSPISLGKTRYFDDVPSSNGFAFVVPVKGSAWLVNGPLAQELQPGSVQLFEPRVGFKCVNLEAYDRINIVIAQSKVEEFGGPKRAETVRGAHRVALTAPFAAQLARHMLQPAGPGPDLDFDTVARVLISLLMEPGAYAGAGEIPGRARAALFAVACRLIAEEFANPALSSGSLARLLGVSLRTLQLAFHEREETVADRILEARASRTAALLADGRAADRSIFEIALSCGFNDPAHFSRAFKRRFGVSPRTYRQAHLGSSV